MFSVYTLLDPTSGECRYVGISKDVENRAVKHLTLQVPQTRNWISSLNSRPRAVVVARDLPYHALAQKVVDRIVAECEENGVELLNRRQSETTRKSRLRELAYFDHEHRRTVRTMIEGTEQVARVMEK